MKKTFITLVALFAFTFGITNITHAQMGMMGGTWDTNPTNNHGNQELKTVLSSILKTQNISEQSQIDCSRVTNDQFEKLGDAYMGTMFASDTQHEAMDEMMGGEGSASLQQAHINMGRSYLGCWSGYHSGPVSMPMMGGFGMMGTYGYQPDINSGNFHRDMDIIDHGCNGFGEMRWLGSGLVMVLFWILVIAGIIVLVRMVTHRRETHNTATKSALDILKERYAQGEIDKEEFETKKKDL